MNRAAKPLELAPLPGDPALAPEPGEPPVAVRQAVRAAIELGDPHRVADLLDHVFREGYAKAAAERGGQVTRKPGEERRRLQDNLARRALWIGLEAVATAATIASLGLVSVNLVGQALAALVSAVLWIAVGLHVRVYGLAGLNVVLLGIGAWNLWRAIG